MGVMVGALFGPPLLLLLGPYFLVARAEQQPQPVDFWGQLVVEGNRIISSKTGLPVRLRGMALYQSKEMPEFWNREAILWLAEDWRCTLIKAPMLVEWGGYLTNPEVEEAKVRTVVSAAIEAGIYVLVEWHEHNAMWHTDEATDFFSRMARDFGSYPNVLFAPWGLPEGWHEWLEHIRPYHQQLVPVIRQHTENLIVVGTGDYGHQVEEASLATVPGSNLAYALRWYGASHDGAYGQTLRGRIVAAASSVPLFATEWGGCEHYGGGGLDFANTEIYLELHERFNISDANFAVYNKAEDCAVLKVGTSATPPWGPEDLTIYGQWVRQNIIDDWDFPEPTSTATTTTTESTVSSTTTIATTTRSSTTETDTTMSNFTTTTTTTGTTSSSTGTQTSITVTGTSITTSTTLSSITTSTSVTSFTSTATSTTVIRQERQERYEFLAPGETLGVAVPSRATTARGACFALALALLPQLHGPPRI